MNDKFFINFNHNFSACFFIYTLKLFFSFFRYCKYAPYRKLYTVLYIVVCGQFMHHSFYLMASYGVNLDVISSLSSFIVNCISSGYTTSPSVFLFFIRLESQNICQKYLLDVIQSPVLLIVLSLIANFLVCH